MAHKPRGEEEALPEHSRGHAERYDYVVYLDESVKPPACRILVEKLDCGKELG
ncbi:hypothetical protein [Pyrodictium occultum]|uniref:hypothetical protein n=1 Tax=Pyrodictium occultum TaxID=2309 RepID=UPI001443172A|nr:hypothetical protein [Pyrodictium occultum]